MRLLKSEDAIDHVAYKIMIADWSYDEHKGMITTHRGVRAKHAITRYLSLAANAKKREEQTVPLEPDVARLLTNEHENNPANEAADREECEERVRYVRILLNSLTDVQQQCMTLHYINGLKQVEVASILGISKQAVRQNLKAALKSLKEIVGAPTNV